MRKRSHARERGAGRAARPRSAYARRRARRGLAVLMLLVQRRSRVRANVTLAPLLMHHPASAAAPRPPPVEKRRLGLTLSSDADARLDQRLLGLRRAQGVLASCPAGTGRLASMDPETSIAEHWADRDVYGLIVSALERASKSLDSLTVEDLAPVDHFHARGFPATVDLADRLPVEPGHHILDVGCGLGGPARYFATRFQCRVTGIDITPAFVDAARRLTALLGLEGQVTIDYGNGQSLSYADGVFDGAYTQHVTMNVADRARFFSEIHR